MKRLIISIVLVNLLAACASGKPKETAAPAAAAPTAAAPTAEAPTAAAPTSAAPVEVAPAAAAPEVAEPAPEAVAEVDPLSDPNSILSKRSTHYPFDVSVVQDEDKPLVIAHATYLSEHPERNVRLEGNCDERGSNEYNLALGQRRADGVKKMLILGGVKTSQIKTVSYGEERPKATGHNEASWKQNRRTDIVY